MVKEDSQPAWITAWKTVDGCGLTPCDLDDPLVTEFRVNHLGQFASSSYLTFSDRFLAEEVHRALYRQFEAGKQAAKAELKTWLG